jgi:hypothetical protein
MVAMARELSFTSVVEAAAKLPFVRVDRAGFLTKNLNKLCAPDQLQKAVEDGTLNAGIPIEILDSLANAVIRAEAVKVTAASTGLGFGGGLAMIATIPADFAQFYGFVIRIAQELAYIYGWEEIFTESSELDDSTESQLILFIGVMSGVGAANAAVAKLFGETAMRAVAKKLLAHGLAKRWYFIVAKKIAELLGKKLLVKTFANGVAKVVPVLGGVLSGGLTLASFVPMAHRLKKHLSKLAHMSREEYDKYASKIVIDEDADIDETVVLDVEAEIGANCWICSCGKENKGNFCTHCGTPKPAGLPQYKCDKCSWEPDDATQPPNFCPICGDPFDEGDIVVA